MAEGGLRLGIEGVAKRFGGFTALEAIDLPVGRGS